MPTQARPARGDDKIGDGWKFGRVSLGECPFASLRVSDESALGFSADLVRFCIEIATGH